jgi:hypothetical protein
LRPAPASLRARLLLALAAGAAALILAAPAGATIVVQKGMAGIRLGMTPSAVRSVLGAPLAVVRGDNEFGSFTQYRYPHRVRVFFQGDVSVTAIRTTGVFERTASDVGVGSTEAAVKAGVRRVHCLTEFGFRHCLVGRREAGRRVTDFFLRNGNVVRVVVGFVID